MHILMGADFYFNENFFKLFQKNAPIYFTVAYLAEILPIEKVIFR